MPPSPPPPSSALRFTPRLCWLIRRAAALLRLSGPMRHPSLPEAARASGWRGDDMTTLWVRETSLPPPRFISSPFHAAPALADSAAVAATGWPDASAILAGGCARGSGWRDDDATALGPWPTSVRKRQLHAALLISGNHGDPPCLPHRRPRMPQHRPRLPRRHLHTGLWVPWFDEDDALCPARVQVVYLVH